MDNIQQQEQQMLDDVRQTQELEQFRINQDIMLSKSSKSKKGWIVFVILLVIAVLVFIVTSA